MSEKSTTTGTKQGRPSKAKTEKTGTAAELPTTETKAAGAMHLPVLVPEMHVRHIPMPRIEMAHVPVPHVHLPVPDAVRSRLPEPTTNRLVWYGGLAGLAAFGVIGWPVAGVVAAGTYVAEHRAKAAMHEELVAAGQSVESVTHSEA
jgi:hypothetical protein